MYPLSSPLLPEAKGKVELHYQGLVIARRPFRSQRFGHLLSDLEEVNHHIHVSERVDRNRRSSWH